MKWVVVGVGVGDCYCDVVREKLCSFCSEEESLVLGGD